MVERRKMFWRKPFILAVLSMVLLAFIAFEAQAGTFTEYTASDGRIFKVFVPTEYRQYIPVPIIVMLHGCLGNPDIFAAQTQMNDLAEEETFLVVYPDQPASANPIKCWNWFLPEHQARGTGEPASIAGIANEVKDRYHVNSHRIYVAGLSAGGAMTVIMGATYPDLFAAIGVNSGLEFKAATTVATAGYAMAHGGPDPVTQGNLAYAAMGKHERVVPVIVFHGMADQVVNPVNGNQIISQWAQTNDLALDKRGNDNIDDIADEIINGQVPLPNGRSYTHYIYKTSHKNGHKNDTGAVVMEKYVVDGMGHAWSGGGPVLFSDPLGPNASLIQYEFFMDHPKYGKKPIHESD